MKKIIILLMGMVLIFALTACDNKTVEDTPIYSQTGDAESEEDMTSDDTFDQKPDNIPQGQDKKPKPIEFKEGDISITTDKLLYQEKEDITFTITNLREGDVEVNNYGYFKGSLPDGIILNMTLDLKFIELPGKEKVTLKPQKSVNLVYMNPSHNLESIKLVKSFNGHEFYSNNFSIIK